MQHRFLAGGIGLAVTVLVLAWLAADDDAIQRAGGRSPAQTSARSAGPVTPFDWSSPVTPTAAPPLPTLLPQQPLGAPSSAVLITMTTAQTLQVGEVSELRISLGGNAAVGEVIFAIQFDPNVLQARAGTEGDLVGTEGAETDFVADISDAGDRVQIRSAVLRKTLAGAGSVAVVQYQAVAPSVTSSIVITNVSVRDLAGNSMPFALSSPHLQVTAASLPPPLFEVPRPDDGAPLKGAASESVDTGD